ncbi:MAG: replicative DNA helicase, partial [Thermotogaceae bacterium]|nr:replicative DNA helicase [Thermotogaceae bacterium]
RAKARRIKMEHNVQVLFVDYLQLMHTKGRSDNRQQEISEISRSMKLLARELDITVVALSQLSRAVEQREDKMPRLSDLRESGAIEQDADTVMFLYREDYYKDKSEVSDSPQVTKVIIGKQRNGPVGTIELMFHPKTATFYDKAFEVNR